jgi:uncharacterized membrane protein YGL010W
VTSLVDRLASYAEYHRDRRNIATHFLGIPMIMVSAQGALAKIGIGPVNLGTAATAVLTRYYREIDPSFGVAMAGLLGATLAIGSTIAAMPVPIWAGTCATLFVGGWALQFLGHYFEGRKPAFLDDLRATLDGPMFIVAEMLCSLGLWPELRAEIEHRAGPTRWGRLADAALATA